MKSATPRRAKGLLAKVVSLLTLPALFVAPACTSLCAAQPCAQAGYSSATEGHCHAATSMHHELQRIHAVKKCNSPEMPPATLTSNNKSDVLRASRSTAPAAMSSGFSQESPTIPIVRIRSSPSSAPPLAQADPLIATSILRI
jgi:hypothetical protein